MQHELRGRGAEEGKGSSSAMVPDVFGPSGFSSKSVRTGQAEHNRNTPHEQGRRRGFTSWKLDMIDALSVDPEVTDLDFRVAYRLMQHVNSVSRLAWPSVARLAAQLGKSEDRIRASTKRLQALHWLEKGRKSQKASNEYRFLDQRLEGVMSRMLDRVDAIGMGDDDHAELHGQNSDDHAELRGGDHADLPVSDHADLHGKHLNNNYLRRTPSIPGSEVGKGTYPRDEIPTEQKLFGPWIKANIPDESKRREAMRLLHAGEMTAAILRGLAA